MTALRRPQDNTLMSQSIQKKNFYRLNRLRGREGKLLSLLFGWSFPLVFSGLLPDGGVQLFTKCLSDLFGSLNQPTVHC